VSSKSTTLRLYQAGATSDVALSVSKLAGE
jgi:hypothetical protein